MSGLKTLAFILLPLALAGCFEKPEVTQARLAQFNGKTVDQVAMSIGHPTIQNENTAVWLHEAIHTQYDPPIYYPFPGGWHRVGGYGGTSTYREYCKYTAKLKSGRVVSGRYEGNSCRRFAPTIKPKT
jgi:hypothetical protein